MLSGVQAFQGFFGAMAFAEGIGILDGLIAGSDVAAASVGAGGFFATLFDKCSLGWDI